MTVKVAGAVLALAVLALGSGCSLVNRATGSVESQSDEFGSEITAVELENVAGDITVTGGEGKLVVKRELTQQPTRKSHAEITKNGSTLKLSGSCTGAVMTCQVDWDIRLPREVAVKVFNKSGNVTLKGINSKDIDVRSKLGDVQVTATGGLGKLAAHSEGGDVTVNLPGGQSYNVTASAKERLGKADVQVPTGSGPTINASSERGDVVVRNG